MDEGRESMPAREQLSERPAAALVEHAVRSFGPLHSAERRLLEAIAIGSTPDGSFDVAVESPTVLQRIRSALIRWLCVDRAAREWIDPKGIWISEAQVVDHLDLHSVDLPFALILTQCTVLAGINLTRARVAYLQITDSVVGPLVATRLRVTGTVAFRRLTVHGELSLDGAYIEGNLLLMEALLSNGRKRALGLEGAFVGGKVDLGKSFRADGFVHIYSTRIGKGLVCGGVINAPLAAVALRIDTSQIGGSVLLRRGCRILGTTRLFETSIDGSLDFQGASLNARGGLALVVEGVRVGGSIFMMRDGEAPYAAFCCNGGLRMCRTVVNGNVEMKGARLRARRYAAANLSDMRIDGRLLAGGFDVRGETVLVRTVVKNDASFNGASLTNRFGPALRARGLYCGGSLSLNDGFNASGAVALRGAEIGDEFNASNAVFAGDDRDDSVALDLTDCKTKSSLVIVATRFEGGLILGGAVIGTSLDLSRSEVRGMLWLAGASISSHVLLRGLHCRNPGLPVVQADGLRCQGSLVLDDGFVAEGRTNFERAEIQGDFHSVDASFGCTDDIALTLTAAKIGRNLTLQGARLDGALHLPGAMVGGLVDLQRARVMYRSGNAIVADRSVLKGGVRLGEGCFVGGRVSLDAAEVGGNVDLANGTIVNVRRNAMSMVGTHVRGDVIIGFSPVEAARYTEARIVGSFFASKAVVDGNFDCSGLWILNRKRNALVLDGLTVKGIFDMSGAFMTNGIVSMRNATVGSIVDEEWSWSRSRRLALEGFVYTNIYPLDVETRLRWLRHDDPDTTEFDLQDGTTSTMQPYEQLAQFLKRQGREAESRSVAIAKQQRIGEEGRHSIAHRMTHALYGATIRYGYRPQRALLFAPLFIGGLSLAMAMGARDLMIPTNEAASKMWQLRHQLPAGYPTLNAVAYSVDSFVPILNLQQKDSWRPDDKAVCTSAPRQCGKSLRIYLWLHMILGWIVTTLAVAGFTGLVRRD